MNYKIRIFDNKLLILLALIVSFILSLISIGMGATLNLILDSSMGLNEYSLLGVFLFSLLIFISKPIIEGIFTYIKSLITEKNNHKLKGDLLNHIENVPMEQYSKYHSGEFLTRLNNDTENVSSILSDGVIELIKGILTVIVALIYSFYVSIPMTVALLLFMPLLVIWGKYVMPRLQAIYGKKQEIESNLRIFLQEQVQNIVFIKSFNITKDSLDKFKNINKDKMKIVIKSNIFNHIAWGGGNAIGSIAFLTSVGIGCYYVSKGEMTVGAVMGFAQVINFIIWPFTEMMGVIANLQSKFSSKKRVEEIFSIKEENIEEIDTNSQIYKDMHNKNIEKVLKVEDLQFYYDEDNIVLDNLNISFKKGKLIGIIGESGCGKSTLLKLLLGLYETKKGKISIEFNNYNVFSKDLRKYISYVPQDNFLMSGTIKENLLKGNKNATMEEMIEATKKANIYDVIVDLPNGFDTILGESGSGVSLGQAQRIAIARALIRKNPIIILDEPTASLDLETEKIILETLKELAKEYICILVAHGDLAHSYCDEKIILNKKC